MTSAVIDTNILLRLMMKDVESQFTIASEFFRKVESGDAIAKISILVINEVIWLLEKFYMMERKVFVSWLLRLLALKNVKIVEIEKDQIIQVLQKMAGNKFDFTDNYLSEISSAKQILSFDKDFKKLVVKRN